MDEIETFILFEDNAIKIEMATWFDRAVNLYFIKTIEPPRQEYELLVDSALEDMKRKGFIIKGTSVRIPAKIPRIRSIDGLVFVEPFNCLEICFDMLCDGYNEEIINSIEEYYEANEDGNFAIGIFEEPFGEIEGYAAIKKNNIIILGFIAYDKYDYGFLREE